MVTDFNEIFSGKQPCQDVKVFQHFRDWLCPPSSECQSVPEKTENLHILTCLSAWEHLIE